MKPLKAEPPFDPAEPLMRPVPARAHLSRSPKSTPNLSLAQRPEPNAVENNDQAVMLTDEVAARLRISVNQIRKLEKRGAFPIPRLPKLDRHPRYARVLVERFVVCQDLSSLLKCRPR
jgi:hypothetical protein